MNAGPPMAVVFPQFTSRPVVNQVNLLDPFPFRTASDGFLDVLAAEPSERLAMYCDEGWRRRTREGLLPVWRQRLFDATIQETTVHTDAFERADAGRAGLPRGEDSLRCDARPVPGRSPGDPVQSGAGQHRPRRDRAPAKRPPLSSRLSDAGAHVTQLCDADYATHLLAYWVREQQALPLEEAVWRLTGSRQRYMAFTIGAGSPSAQPPIWWRSIPRVSARSELERVWDFPGGTDRLVVRSVGVECVWVNGTAIRCWAKISTVLCQADS